MTDPVTPIDLPVRHEYDPAARLVRSWMDQVREAGYLFSQNELARRCRWPVSRLSRLLLGHQRWGAADAKAIIEVFERDFAAALHLDTTTMLRNLLKACEASDKQLRPKKFHQRSRT